MTRVIQETIVGAMSAVRSRAQGRASALCSRGRARALTGVAAALLLTSQVQAGDVSGSVRSNEEVKAKPSEAVRAPYWQEWNGFIDPKKPAVDYAREVSAVLIGPVASKDGVTVALRDGTLTPGTIVVQIGTTLRIRNEDDFGHELYVEGLKGFDAVETSPGSTRSIVMEQTGVFALRDKLAPYVRGHLHVIAKLTAVANPTSGGDFSFKDVVPGNYTLKVFRADQEVSVSEVEVGSKTLELDAIPVTLKPGK